jgi:3-phosphoshikimate 1-carboxyvinyltransferase
MDSVLRVSNGGTFTGSILVPGDKSISHRAIMLGALSDGLTRVTGCLLSEDVMCTINAFRVLGVQVELNTSTEEVLVHGVGLHGLKNSPQPIYVGNSGTSMRLMAGIFSGAGLSISMTGDSSLSSRPMRRICEPLVQMGANLKTSSDGTAPLYIGANNGLKGITYAMPVASAQVKSCILLAGLYADTPTKVIERIPTRDHTETMFETFGVSLVLEAGSITLSPAQKPIACDVVVPADISSATFFLVGGAIGLDSRISMKGIGVNKTRSGIIRILEMMNAKISVTNVRMCGGEKVADITVASSDLHGVEIPLDCVAAAIDEFPAIFIAAACAKGVTVLRGATELRHKESDRIEVMASGLRTLGIDLETYEDGIKIVGGCIGSGTVDAQGDHRVAMAFSIAALKASGNIDISNAEGISTSFPEFVSIAKSVGLRVE